MKTVSAALTTLLGTGQYWTADLFTFTLVDGTVHRFCSGDADITSGGNVFSCGGTTGPYFKKDKATIEWKRGLQTSQLNFTVLPGTAGTINGIAFLQACKIGLFDYASCTVERAYMPTYGDVSAGTIIAFDGVTGEVVAGRSSATFTINSWTDIFNLYIPRNLYQSGCINSLYDSACTLSKAAYAVAGTVAASSTVSSINATLAEATGYFDLGSIIFTSGANDGITRAVKSYTNGSPSVVTLIPPLPFTPAAGDTFTIYPGCDKTSATCNSKFANLANFRGFPFIPVPETAV